MVFYGCTKRLLRRANPARKSEVRGVELMNVLVNYGRLFTVSEVDDFVVGSTQLFYLIQFVLGSW